MIRKEKNPLCYRRRDSTIHLLLGSVPLQSIFRLKLGNEMNLVFNMVYLNSKLVPMSIPPKFTAISCSRRPTRINSGGCFLMSFSNIPARDRSITFGKYKGKMLGSLPSSYLKWVSKNLRAGDTEAWAKLADEVLVDSVYRDRLEWELAESVLNGNNVGSSSSGNGSVSVLLEMSERFGWDNDDKVGWSKIDFGLLGTSKGGRIPRRNAERDEEMAKNGGGGRRRVRARVSRPPLETSGGGKLGKGSGNEGQCVGDEDTQRVIPMANPFPGREALLNKVRRTLDR